MKIKNIIILTLAALVLFGYNAEAKKKKKELFTLPVIKTNVEGFSESFIEIDQKSITVDLNSYEITIHFKKVAEFPYNYTPRIEALEISSVGSNNEDVSVQISTNFFKPSNVLTKLNEFIKQPVGSTIKLKLSAFSYSSAKEIKEANIQGLAITNLVVVDQEEFDEALNFILQLKKVILSGDQVKLRELVDYNYIFPDGSKWMDYTGADVKQPEVFLPIEKKDIQKITHANLKDGYYTISKSVKDNHIAYFRFYFNDYFKCFSLMYSNTYIKYIDGETDSEGWGGYIAIAKVNGKYKIVRLDAAG